MNLFDKAILTFLNQFAQKSWTIDASINFISQSDLFKGFVLVPVLWWMWFQNNEEKRKVITSCIAATFVAIGLSRCLSIILPFRTRPIHSENLSFILPFESPDLRLIQWNSLPSDHAVLFFCLSTGIFLANRRVGAFSILYTLLIICLPRVYLGLHYPTDILLGALMGISIMLLFNQSKIKNSLYATMNPYSQTHTGLFYSIMFILSLQIATMFNDIRQLVKSICQVYF